MNRIVSIALLGGATLLMVGCLATGTTSDGMSMIGFTLGDISKADPVISGAVSSIPFVGPWLSQLFLGAGGTGAIAYKVVQKVERKRRKADISREGAERDLAVAESKLANGSA